MILVTGGAGYIGSHTVKALQKAGLAPLIFDNLSTGHRSFVRATPFIEGDIRSPEDLKKVFTQYPIEGVIHFAAKALVAESHRKPEVYYQVNVDGGKNLLEAMEHADVKCLIFSSTCATYGVPTTIPITEEAPQVPINPYGETKLMLERAIEKDHRRVGLEYLSFRYFNAAGADPEGEFGENHVPETHLIPLILDAALSAESDIQILGTDYPTPDGTCLRDYIHVTDLARAHVMGMKSLLERRVTSQAINLGTGFARSVREVIDTARKVTQTTFPVKEAPRRDGDPPILVAAVERAREVLGWSAELSQLEYIIETAWSWHRRGIRAGH
jgi:UDP-glucose 4-epimerase